MTFVVDASIVVAWAFDEVNVAASGARERMRREAAMAPALWWFEVRNALVQASVADVSPNFEPHASCGTFPAPSSLSIERRANPAF